MLIVMLFAVTVTHQKRNNFHNKIEINFVFVMVNLLSINKKSWSDIIKKKAGQEQEEHRAWGLWASQ